jgi:RecA/RadA recombinase
MPKEVQRGRKEARQRDSRNIPERRKLRREQPAPEREAGQVKDVAVISAADAMSKVFSGRVDKIDKDLGLIGTLGKQPRMSTGQLSLDLLLGNGGLVPGFHIFFGGEGSAKSTVSMKTMGSSLALPIPIRGYYDAEGAVDRRYTSQVIRTDDFESVFGAKDSEGRWYKPALCRYYDSNIIEHVFRSMHRQLSFLPDKSFHEKNNSWMLVFDRKKEQVQLMKDLLAAKAISEPSKRMYSSTGNYWCETDSGAPQAAFFVDSLPQLIPEAIDEEEMSDKASGIQARFLGAYMRLVRGKLRSKGAVMNAVNQLRKNVRPQPGQMDWYEPAGEAMKYNSDSRTMLTSRVPLDGFPRAENKGLGEEKSVEFPGAFDRYAFKGLTNIKNKYGQPFRKGSIRIWISDGEGTPRGIDPVYDTYTFLDKIGALPNFVPSMVTDHRKKFRINLKPIADVDWTWPSFKALVIAQDYGNNRLLKRAITELGAPRFRLREYCFKLIESGKAETMLVENERKGKTKALIGEDLEAED